MRRLIFGLVALLVIGGSGAAWAGPVRQVTSVFSTNSTNASIPSSPDYWWTQITVYPLDATNSSTTAASGTATVWVLCDAPGTNGTAVWVDLTGSIDFTDPTVDIFNGSFYGIRVVPSDLDAANYVVVAKQWKEQ